MMETGFLPPYSFLIGYFIGAIAPLVAKESAEYDIFMDKVVFEGDHENPVPVRINNVKVGDANLPIVEVDVKVHAQEGTFPVIKNGKTFAKCVRDVAAFITNDPGKKLEIVVDDHKVVVDYNRQTSQFEIKAVPYVENTDSIQKEFATYADNYLFKVYGVRLVQEKDGTKYDDAVQGYVPPDVAAYGIEPPKDKNDNTGGVNPDDIGDADPYYAHVTMTDDIYNKQTEGLSHTIQGTVKTCGETLGNVYEAAKKYVKTTSSPQAGQQTTNVSEITKDSSIKETLMNFIRDYPWIAAGITIGAVAGAIVLFMKRRAIGDFIARKFKRESVGVDYNKKLEYAVYDIANVLAVVYPQMEAAEIVDRSLKMVREIKTERISKLNKAYKSLVRESSGVGMKILAMIAVLLKAGMFVIGAAMVAGLLGTLLLVIRNLVVGGVPMEYIIGVAVFPISLLPWLGLLAAGYVLVKKQLDSRAEMRTVSSHEIRSSLERANAKMFRLAYNV